MTPSLYSIPFLTSALYSWLTRGLEGLQAAAQASQGDAAEADRAHRARRAGREEHTQMYTHSGPTYMYMWMQMQMQMCRCIDPLSRRLLTRTCSPEITQTTVYKPQRTHYNLAVNRYPHPVHNHTTNAYPYTFPSLVRLTTPSAAIARCTRRTSRRCTSSSTGWRRGVRGVPPPRAPCAPRR